MPRTRLTCGGYRALADNGTIQLASWSNVRRRFYEMVAAGHAPIAAETLARINSSRRSEVAPPPRAERIWQSAIEIRFACVDRGRPRIWIDQQAQLLRFASQVTVPSSLRQ
jgi:hypothetical protein